VAGQRFDLIATNPPQMPTPPGRERDDAVAAADNGGLDGWSLLDRVIAGAADHLDPGGRVVFSIFAFLGRKRACAKLEAAGFVATVLASEVQSFPRLGFERLEHLREFDAEGTIPRAGRPATVERVLVQGTLPT
jgi:methylase of polypeptide subunit release factors